MIRVEHGDCLAEIPKLVADGVVADAICCDPPYHLVGAADRSKYKMSEVAQNKLGRLVGGFMGQTWDGGDIAFRPETWATIGTALRPGGFLVAFGGTRGYHRMACAIEDAGFVIQDCLMWLFATGFPKNRTLLKPAYEPIVLAYKPGGKRTMQVDECRIGDFINTTPDGRERLNRRNFEQGYRPSRYEHDVGVMPKPGTPGRWPANICHDGSDEVVAAFPAERGGGFGISGGSPDGHGIYNSGFPRGDMRTVGYGDSGSAARFFFSAKAGAQDRWGSRHPTVKPVELMKWLVALVCPPGGTVLDPFAGSGTTAVAALGTGRNAILIEREDQYVADIRERVAFYEGGGAHSVQAKNRNRKTDHGPLFAEPAFDEALDCKRSFDAAIQAIGEQVKAGEPLPTGGYFGGEK